jgi:hypothetical protein
MEEVIFSPFKREDDQSAIPIPIKGGGEVLFAEFQAPDCRKLQRYE